MKTFIKNKLDYNTIYRLSKVKNSILGYWKKYYSQVGEDILLKAIFENKNDGFYVDVGAHHPFRYSNTYLLYSKGWRGINIDARPDIIDFFNEKRKRDINLSIGISDEKSKLTYYAFNDPGINTFSLEAAQKQLKNKDFFILSENKIDVIPLEEVLEKHLPQDKQIDFMNIDCEGFDLKVLKSFDIKKYHPTVILIEDHGFDLGSLHRGNPMGEVFNYLIEHGYKLKYVMGSSLFFFYE